MYKPANKLTQSQLNALHKYSSILVLGFIAVGIASLFWRLMMSRMDFYNELWGPAYLLVQGKSPYDTASLNPILPAVWFPMAIGFFFPLGWLPETPALQVWFIFNILEICAVVYLVQGDKRSLTNTAALALFCFFFPFVLNHLNLGQFSITVMLCLVLSAHFAEKRRDWLAAFFLALALSKPQLGFLAVFGLGMFYFGHGGFSRLFRFGLQTTFASLVLTLPLFLFHPAWIPDWIQSMQSNYTWLHPSLFSIFTQSLGLLGTLLWTALVILALVVTQRLWTKLPASAAMPWTLGITTIVTPYVWSWDFVLLLPVWMYAFTQSGWRRKLILIVVYAAVWYGAALVQSQAGSDNQEFWWAPIGLISMLAFTTDWKRILDEGRIRDVHPLHLNAEK